MKKLCLLLSLTCLISTVQAEVITSIIDRKNGDKIEIECSEYSDAQCSLLNIVHTKDGTEELLGSYDQEGYDTLLQKMVKKDKVRLKDNYFLATQGIASLPWDNDEFVLAYFLMSPISIPLTLAGVVFDVATIPLSTGFMIKDMADGNIGKRIKRKMEKKENLKISHWKFETLYMNLKRAQNSNL